MIAIALMRSIFVNKMSNKKTLEQKLETYGFKKMSNSNAYMARIYEHYYVMILINDNNEIYFEDNIIDSRTFEIIKRTKENKHVFSLARDIVCQARRIFKSSQEQVM